MEVIKMTLIEPIQIARPMRKMKVSDSSYSHLNQSRWSDRADFSVMATTWNRTQTFDNQGKPKDSDND